MARHLLGPATVNSFRATFNRTGIQGSHVPDFDPINAGVGLKNAPRVQKARAFLWKYAILRNQRNQRPRCSATPLDLGVCTG